MKKILLTILISIILFPSVVSAEMSVLFESDPIFAEENILPGDSFSKYIKIHNSDASSRKLYIRTLNESSDEQLPKNLSVDIDVSGDVVYDGSLSDLFANDWLELPDLESGEEKQVNMHIEFDAYSGNNLQKNDLSFDLLVKSELRGESSQCNFNCGHPWQWKKWFTWYHSVLAKLNWWRD